MKSLEIKDLKRGDVLFYDYDPLSIELVLSVGKHSYEARGLYLSDSSVDKHSWHDVTRRVKISEAAADRLCLNWRALLGWPLDKPEPEPCWLIYVPSDAVRIGGGACGGTFYADIGLDVRVSTHPKTCFADALPIHPAVVLAALEDKKRLDKWERMARHDGRPAFFEIRRYGSMRVYEQNFANYRASTIREAIDAREEG